MRGAVGVWFVVVSGTYLAPVGQGGWLWMAVGLLAAASGASLLIGFLTPFGVLAGLTVIGAALSWPPLGAPVFLNELPAALLVVVAAGSVALLGPGALSLDARMFGRREISIPPKPDHVSPED